MLLDRLNQKTYC